MIVVFLFLELVNSYRLPNMIINKINKINGFRVSYIVSLEENSFNNNTLNSSLANIKSVDYDEKEDMWILDLDLYNSEKKEEKEEKEEKEDNFPSFSKFLENRNKNQEIITRKYFEEADKKANKIEKEMKNPHSKDLKLMRYDETIKYAKLWIYDMINSGKSNTYPKFIYDNIYDMRAFCKENISRKYFYIGYNPKDSNNGPYYIGAFRLIPEKRELDAHLIMQNPNYEISDKNTNRFINYKKELLLMTYEANVFFKFDKLKNPANERYYYSWLFEDND